MYFIKSKSNTLLRLSLFICLISFIIPAQSHAYNASNWEKLTKEEKRRIKDIPGAMLRDMSTEQLIEACVNTRYTLFLFAYNSLQNGFAKFLNEYNGLQELLNRNDAAIHLINFYKNIHTNGYNSNWESEKIGEYLHKIIVVEVLLSSDIILNQLSRADVKTLLSELLKKNYEKTLNIEDQSIFGLEKNAFTIAKLIFNKGKDNNFQERVTQDEGIHYLLLNAKLRDQKDNNDLVNIAKDFLLNF